MLAVCGAMGVCWGGGGGGGLLWCTMVTVVTVYCAPLCAIYPSLQVNGTFLITFQCEYILSVKFVHAHKKSMHHIWPGCRTFQDDAAHLSDLREEGEGNSKWCNGAEETIPAEQGTQNTWHCWNSAPSSPVKREECELDILTHLCCSYNSILKN